LHEALALHAQALVHRAIRLLQVSQPMRSTLYGQKRPPIIGARAPLHVTAAGKLFLLEEGFARLRDYAKRTGRPFRQIALSHFLLDMPKLWRIESNCRKYLIDIPDKIIQNHPANFEEGHNQT
jgi:hypothetical protein